MQIQINHATHDKSDALDEHINTEIQTNAGRFADRLTRVEVHIADLNADKPGPDDKRCRIEARPAGSDPVTVEATADDFYDAVSDAAGKLKRLLTSRFDR